MDTSIPIGLALLVGCGAVAGAQTTEADLKEPLAQFAQATTLDAYKEVGQRDPAWNGAALRLLWAYWPMLAGGADDAAVKRLLELARPLEGTGCTDPLVQQVISIAYSLNDDSVSCEKWLRQAVEGYKTSPYPRARAWWAAQRLAWMCRQAGDAGQEEARQWADLSAQWLGQAAGEPVVTQGMQRIFWRTIASTVLDDQQCDPDQMVAALLNTPGSDPWLAHVAAGYREVNLAWRDRGSGWAYEVTAKGWEGFDRHLKLAEEHLVEAWKLHPEFPEAAARMVAVAMAGESEGPDAASTREWFDRAVKAQLDFMLAYGSYGWSLHPRWGGTIEEMYGFGVECLNTGRFGTPVPNQYWEMLSAIEWDEGAPDIWRREGVYADVTRYFQGLLAEAGGDAQAIDEVKTIWLGAAQKARQFEEVVRLAGELGDRLGVEEFRKRFFLEPSLVVAEAQAATGPLGADVRKAIRLADEEDLRAAEAAYRDLVARNQDPKVWPYLRDRAETLRMEVGLQGAEWTSILPSDDFAGYGCSGAPWKVEADGSLSVTVAPNIGFWLGPQARVQGDYEVRGEIHVDPTHPDSAAGVGLAVVPPVWPGYTAFGVYTGDLKAQRMALGLIQDRTTAAVAERNTFLVRVRDMKATGFINDQQVIADVEVPDYRRGPWLPLKLSFFAASTGDRETSVRFANVEVRGLK